MKANSPTRPERTSLATLTAIAPALCPGLAAILLAFSTTPAAAVGSPQGVSRPAQAARGWQQLPVSRAGTANRPLAQALRELCVSLGLQCAVSAALGTPASWGAERQSLSALLESLRESHGLEHYHDGHTLHLSHRSETVDLEILLRASYPADVLRVLGERGLLDPRWPIREGASYLRLVVRAPPGYAAVIRQTVEALESGTIPPAWVTPPPVGAAPTAAAATPPPAAPTPDKAATPAPADPPVRAMLPAPAAAPARDAAPAPAPARAAARAGVAPAAAPAARRNEAPRPILPDGRRDPVPADAPPAGIPPLRPWSSAPVNYASATDKPVAEVLRDICASLQMICVVGDEVRGTTAPRFRGQSLASVLASLSRAFGFNWYHDGQVLHVTPTQDVKSAVVTLKSARLDELVDSLRRSGAWDERFAVHQDAELGLLRVSGPPRFVEVVRETADALDKARENVAARQRERSRDNQEQAPPVATEVRFFALTFGQAEDMMIAAGGRQQLVEGVATVLRRLMGQRGAGRALVPTVRRETHPASPAVAVEGVRPRPAQPPAGDVGAGTGPAPQAPAPAGTPGAPAARAEPPGLPMIEADARTNSVIVHDLPERMHLYPELIARLDVAPQLVQIQASIVDVSSEQLDALGVDWGSGNIAVGGGTSATLSESVAGQLIQGALASRAGAATVLTSQGSIFMARVSALAQRGQAIVKARPGVLTIDNFEAVLENSRSIYVRLAGERDVNLFNINAGTSLRVTPTVIGQGAGRKIKLLIKIDDDSLLSEQVDAIPIVQRNTISTQAVIAEGESLLIGGYSYERESTSGSGVPGLRDLPVLGQVFRTDRKTTQRMERMYVITPSTVVR
jgi:type III secretion protein C